MTQRVRQGLYLSVDLLEEMRREAARCGCSLSEIMQAAWRLAHPSLEGMPGIDDYWPTRANDNQTEPVGQISAEA